MVPFESPRNLLWLFAAIGLFGSGGSLAASYRLKADLSLTDEGNIRVCLKSRFTSNEGGVELRSVTVDDPAERQWRPLWELHASESGTFPVKCFLYGEVVGGLIQRVVPSQIEVKKFYRLEVSAPGEHAQVYFKILDRRSGRKLKVTYQPPD